MMSFVGSTLTTEGLRDARPIEEPTCEYNAIKQLRNKLHLLRTMGGYYEPTIDVASKHFRTAKIFSDLAERQDNVGELNESEPGFPKLQAYALLLVEEEDRKSREAELVGRAERLELMCRKNAYLQDKVQIFVTGRISTWHYPYPAP